MGKVTFFYEYNELLEKTDNNYYVGTFSIELPLIDDLLKFVSKSVLDKSTVIPLKVGFSKRNKKDQFVKKTGQLLSTSRASYEDFAITLFSRFPDGDARVILKNSKYRINLAIFINRIQIINIWNISNG